MSSFTVGSGHDHRAFVGGGHHLETVAERSIDDTLVAGATFPVVVGNPIHSEGRDNVDARDILHAELEVRPFVVGEEDRRSQRFGTSRGSGVVPHVLSHLVFINDFDSLVTDNRIELHESTRGKTAFVSDSIFEVECVGKSKSEDLTAFILESPQQHVRDRGDLLTLGVLLGATVFVFIVVGAFAQS